MAKDQFTKNWIIENALKVISRYDKGVLTLRALHYQLVSLGMTNDIQHYKRVVASLGDARWDRIVDFDTFSDLDREMIGETRAAETNLDNSVSEAKDQIRLWMEAYQKNRWENQPIYPEVFIEKKALQGVFQRACRDFDVALGACKGYPSLTFLHESSQRFRLAEIRDQKVVIIYFGDYDPSGEDIPRSIHENFSRFGVDVEVRRIALMEHQVREWRLPPAPAKQTDSRTAAWEGLGQVELDAVKPEVLVELCKNAINELFNPDLYAELMEREEEERTEYRKQLVEHVRSV